MNPHLAGTPVLETDRLTLRAPLPQDLEVFRAFYLSDRARHVGGPLTGDRIWRSFGHMIGHWVLRGWGLFVFCHKGTDRALGATGPWFPEGWTEPELGWSAWDPNGEGKGLVQEAARAARLHAYDVLGWASPISYIHPANARSIALAERLGCQPDPDAAGPQMDGWAGTLVYRHPPRDLLT